MVGCGRKEKEAGKEAEARGERGERKGGYRR